jgi:STAS-like domain of unknown function (DUF4325)
MITVNISTDFTKTPGFRTYSDGPHSGEEFYNTILKHKFKEALAANQKLKIVLDGVEGYTSSFLNESFRLLSKDFGADISWNNLIIISEETPKYISKVKEAIYE